MASRTVQFFRIEVGIMPPDHQGDPITRSVLRRFSHFQKLQRMVRYSCDPSIAPVHVQTDYQVASPPPAILRTACPWTAVSATPVVHFMITKLATQCTRTY